MIMKEVKPFGNGAQVLAPKEWIGRKVLLVIQELDLAEIKSQVLDNIKDLSKIVSIVLIGSYARKEQDSYSDVDIVVFCTEKLNINMPNFHIVLVNANRLEEEINLNPALFKSILDEGIPLINSNFLSNIKIKEKYIKNFKKDCYRAYLSNKGLINLDKKQNLISPSVIYSTILRLRALFILKNKYAFIEFKRWLIKNNINFDKLYNIYKLIRDNKSIKNLDLNISEIEKINEFLLKQLK